MKEYLVSIGLGIALVCVIVVVKEPMQALRKLKAVDSQQIALSARESVSSDEKEAEVPRAEVTKQNLTAPDLIARKYDAFSFEHLSTKEVESQEACLARKFTEGHWAEKANQNALSQDERVELADMLQKLSALREVIAHRALAEARDAVEML